MYTCMSPCLYNTFYAYVCASVCVVLDTHTFCIHAHTYICKHVHARVRTDIYVRDTWPKEQLLRVCVRVFVLDTHTICIHTH